MANTEIDKDQTTRIGKLEDRVNQVENELASILAKLSTLEKLAKGLMILAGAALGVDIIPMMGAQ